MFEMFYYAFICFSLPSHFDWNSFAPASNPSTQPSSSSTSSSTPLHPSFPSSSQHHHNNSNSSSSSSSVHHHHHFPIQSLGLQQRTRHTALLNIVEQMKGNKLWTEAQLWHQNHSIFTCIGNSLKLKHKFCLLAFVFVPQKLNSKSS